MSAQGITPAHAGKSQLVKAFQRRSWDHPRVCGEKLIGRLARLDGLGSPPRMRGKVFEQVYTRIPFRITPAYAGKRCSARTPTFRTWDHPRVCGEKRRPSSHSHTLPGSPPRVRGKGEKNRRSRLFPWDHPRVCGEKFHPASDRKLGRVRGTKRSSGPAPAAAPAGPAGSCPASPPWSYPPRITVSRPRP